MFPLNRSVASSIWKGAHRGRIQTTRKSHKRIGYQSTGSYSRVHFSQQNREICGLALPSRTITRLLDSNIIGKKYDESLNNNRIRAYSSLAKSTDPLFRKSLNIKGWNSTSNSSTSSFRLLVKSKNLSLRGMKSVDKAWYEEENDVGIANEMDDDVTNMRELQSVFRFVPEKKKEEIFRLYSLNPKIFDVEALSYLFNLSLHRTEAIIALKFEETELRKSGVLYTEEEHKVIEDMASIYGFEKNSVNPLDHKLKIQNYYTPEELTEDLTSFPNRTSASISSAAAATESIPTLLSGGGQDNGRKFSFESNGYKFVITNKDLLPGASPTFSTLISEGEGGEGEEEKTGDEKKGADGEKKEEEISEEAMAEWKKQVHTRRTLLIDQILQETKIYGPPGMRSIDIDGDGENPTSSSQLLLNPFLHGFEDLSDEDIIAIVSDYQGELGDEINKQEEEFKEEFEKFETEFCSEQPVENQKKPTRLLNKRFQGEYDAILADVDALYSVINSHLQKDDLENQLNNYRASYDMTATAFEKANAKQQIKSWQNRRRIYRELYLNAKNYDDLSSSRTGSEDVAASKENDSEEEPEMEDKETGKVNNNPYLQEMQELTKLEGVDSMVPSGALDNYKIILDSEIKRIRSLNRQKLLRDAVTKCDLNSKEQKDLLKQYIILLAYNSKCLFEPPVHAEYKRWEGLQAFRRLLRLQGDFSTSGISSTPGAIRLHAPLYEKFNNPYEAEVLAMEASASIPINDIFPNVNIYTTEKNQILDITHSILDEDKDYPLQSKLEELAKLCNEYPDSTKEEQTRYNDYDGWMKKRNEKWDLMKEIMSVLVRSADRKDWRATMGVYGHLDPLEMMVKGWTETEKICDEIISATSTRDYSEEYIEAMERDVRGKAQRLEFLKRAIHQQMISDHDGQNLAHIENLTKEYEDISNYIAKQWESIQFGVNENGKKKKLENIEKNDKEGSHSSTPLDYTLASDSTNITQEELLFPEEGINFHTISCNPMLKNQDPVRWYMYPHYCTDLQHVQVEKYLPRRELLNLLHEAVDDITAEDIKLCKEAHENNFVIEDFDSLRSTFTTPPDIYIESLLGELVKEDIESEGVNRQNFGLLSKATIGYGKDITRDGYIDGLPITDVFSPMDTTRVQSFARAEVRKERDHFASLRAQLLKLLDQKTKIDTDKQNRHQFHLGMGALAVMRDDPFMGEIDIPPEKAKSVYQKYKDWATSIFNSSSPSSSETENSKKLDPELEAMQNKIFDNKALLEKRILEEYMLNIYTDFCAHDSDMINRKVLSAVEKDLISHIVPEFVSSEESSQDTKKKSKDRKKLKPKTSTLEKDTKLSSSSSPLDHIPYKFKNVYNELVDAIESYLYKYDENITAAIDSPEMQTNLSILNDLETAIDKVIYTVYGQKHHLNKKNVRLHIKSELMNSIEAHLEAIKINPRKEQTGLSYMESKRAMQSSFYRVMQELNQMGFTNVKEQNYLLNKMRHIMNSWTDEYGHQLVMSSDKLNEHSMQEMSGPERQRKRSEKEVVTSIKVVLDTIFSKENIHTTTMFSSADASLQNMYKSIEEIDDELRYNSVYTGAQDENKYQLHNLTDPTRRKIIRAKYFLDILRSKEDLYEKYIEKPVDYIVDELEDEMREFFEELYEDHPELGNSNFNNFDRVDFHTPESYETPDLRYKIYSDKEKTLPIEGYDESLDDRERKFSYKGAPANARKEFGLLNQIETRQRVLADDSMSLHIDSDDTMNTTFSVDGDMSKPRFKGKERFGFALKDLSADQPDQIDGTKQGVTLIRDTKSKLVRIASLDEEKKRSWKKQLRRTQVHKLGENKD